MKTRVVSFLLALAMILTMVPAQNLQAAEPVEEQPAISTQNEEPTEGKEASFGWDLTLTSLPEGGAWTWQADVLTDYTARISAAQEEAENRLPAKEQTLTLTLALPEGMALPEGGYTYTYGEGLGTVLVNETGILELGGLGGDAQVSAERKDARTLELTVKRAQAEEAAGDLSALDLSLRLKGAALTCDSAALADGAELTLKGTCTSVSWNDTKDEQQAEAGAALTVIREDNTEEGDNADHAEEPGETTDPGEGSGDVPEGTEVSDPAKGEDPSGEDAGNVRSGERTITIEETTSMPDRNVYWIDNNDEEGKRLAVTDFVPKLCYQYVDETGNAIPGQEPVELTADNMEALGLKEFPAVTVTDTGSGQYTVSVAGNLPTQITCTDAYGDTLAGYPKYIAWSLEAPETDDYSFREITEENKNDYPSAGRQLGWYYILYDNYTITITLRSGSFDPDDEKLVEALLKSFTLHIDSGETKNDLLFQTLYEQKRFQIQKEIEGVSGTITITDLWRYNLDGSPIIYKVDSKNNQLVGPLMDKDDYYKVTYDNAGVPNYGAVTDAVYSGGTVYLTLSGMTEYKATKEWLDPEGAKRPTGELQLWRYREGAAYSTAAPVRGSDGNILTVKLTGEDPQTIQFPAEGSTDPALTEGLPKYDTEGYRYIYVVREYLDGVTAEGQTPDSYEQVFGTVADDGTVTDTLPEGTERTSGNTFVYDGGTLSNRIRGSVETTATKNWAASAFQTEFDDVEVELKLQSRPTGDGEEHPWADVSGEDGQPVTRRLDGFFAEQMSLSLDETVSQYGPWGRELEYRWVESGVYQGDSDNLLQEDGTFTLTQSGRKITYRSEAFYSEDGLSTTIVNRIANTIDYDIEKVWQDETGNPTDAPEGAEVTFVIYQTLSGESLDEDKIVAEVTMDGQADEAKTVVNEKLGLTFQETEAWTGKVDLLPEFSEDGAQYEYTLLEVSAKGAENYFPVYETTRSEEDYGYDTRVINQPGEGNRIMVRKEWVDDSDVEHRGDVTIAVYNRKTDEKVGEKVLKNGIWTDWIGIGKLEPDEVYILETSVETDKPHDTNAKELEGDEEVPASHQFETDNHRYEVTYSKAEKLQNDTCYTVENRRLGVINLTITKDWLDGDGQARKEIADAIEELGEDEMITPALQLKFTEEDAGKDGYKISNTGIHDTDTVTLGGEKTPILDQEGDKQSSIQAVDLTKKESSYYFFNLPKYDTSGDIAHYTVEEVWVKANGETLRRDEMAEDYPDIYRLMQDYRVSYGDVTYEVSGLHDVDEQTMDVTNYLSGSKSLTWQKKWEDAYNSQNGLRPDIYLDIYRTVHTDDDKVKTELYLANYKWTAAENDTDYDWQAEVSGAPKYDSLGYEITYYAVEKTHIDAGAFDYEDGRYKLAGKELGTEYDPTAEAIENGDVLDVQAFEENEAHYALKETGTFINRIRNTVSVRGYKLWTNLPAGYKAENLPGVTFALMRSVGDGKEEVATLTIKDWSEISINGRYSLGFDYYGENTLTVDKDGQIVVGSKETESQKLDKYDEAGNLYTYTIQEKEIHWQGANDPQEADSNNPMYQFPSSANTYQMTNGYVGVKGQIDVKKLLALPLGEDDKPEAYPAVTFRLYRTYTTNEGEKSGEETVATKTISSADVQKAYEAAANQGGKVALTLTFREMPKYAPNGSAYVYRVEEIKINLNGYDTWAAEGDYGLDEWDDLTGEKQATSVTGLTAEKDEKIDATFANAQPETTETITLTGTKTWNDYEDAFGFRPNAEAFQASLKLYRSADSQPGQSNGIAQTEVEKGKYTIEISGDNLNGASKWTYTIKGTEGSGELEQYAPNGMPWKYTVKEELPDGSVYTVSPASAGQSGQTISALTNSIYTSSPYKKSWVDEDGTITEDYLGEELTVTFTLQVAEKDGKDGAVTGSWTDAKEYFGTYLADDVREKVFGDNPKFSQELTGRIDDSKWATGGSFSKLPKVIKKVTTGTGSQTWLAYRVVESSIQYGGHTQTVTVQDGQNGSYSYQYETGLFESGKENYASNDATAVNMLPTTDFTVTKKWQGDAANTYGSRPETGRTGYTWEVSFVIQRSTDEATWEAVPVGEKKEDLIVTLYGTDADDSVSSTISGLPTQDLDGKPYTYRARELQPGYTVKDGKVDAEYIVGENETFYDTYGAAYSDNLPEKPNATTAVNSLRGTKVYGEKRWVGKDMTPVTLILQYLKADGGEGTWTELAKVKVDGTADSTHTEPYYECEPWKAVWESLPEVLPGSKTDNGKTQYRVVETVPGGYQQTDADMGSVADGGVTYPVYTFTNIKTVSLTVQKNWSVSGGYKMPEEIQVGLYRTTGTIPDAAGEAVTGDDGNALTRTLKAVNWSGTFENLPKYDENGKAYTYYARELDSSGKPYGTTADATDLRIVHSDSQAEDGNSFTTGIRNIEQIQLGGTKTWVDHSNAYGTRPKSLALTLKRSVEGGQAETVTDATPVWSKTDTDRWTYTYSGLPYADDHGKVYTYTVEETAPAAAGEAGTAGDTYTPAQEGNDFTNTLTGTTEVAGTKTWRDGSNADGTRPKDLTLTLYRKAGVNGEEQPVTDATPDWDKTTNPDQWTYTYRGLPKYDSQGVRYEYRVEETVPDGYEKTDQDGFALTNTQLTSVTVEKLWGIGEGGQMPASVTIGLYRTEKADGTDMSPVAGADEKQLTLELSETNGGWKGTFENLLKYNPSTGARYYYGIAELSVNGGSGTGMGDYIVHYNGSEETGFVVTNITPISITGTKTWVDHSNAYGTRPEDLTLTLYRQTAGGQEETVDIQPQWTKAGDNGDQWTYTYSDLPLTDDDANVYTYWVKETRAVPEGEAGKAGDTYKMTQEGYDFTNTLTGTTEVTGVKTWRDNGKTDRGSIELTLYRNDEVYDTLTLDGEGDAWDYAFEDLPKYDEKGALYVYEVRETDAPEGYDVYYTEEGITNVQQGGLRLTKTVTGTGGDREKAFSFTVKLDDPAISGAYGDLFFQNGEATVNLSDGESAEASGLPADVAYTVTENGAEADGYTVKSEGAAGEILPGEISEIRFENHKDAPVSAAGDSARTGDDSPVILYLASALLALLLAAFALLLRRRLKR